MIYKKICLNCGKPYESKYIVQRHCSRACAHINKTILRYLRESGNWDLYFKQLLTRGKKATSDLTPEILVELLRKQNYECALSGEPMTCIKKRGEVIRTNASIDRIDPKGEYNINNIQLVCTAVNSFRTDLSVEEFINWCKKVANYGIYKESKTLQERMGSGAKKK